MLLAGSKLESRLMGIPSANFLRVGLYYSSFSANVRQYFGPSRNEAGPCFSLGCSAHEQAVGKHPISRIQKRQRGDSRLVFLGKKTANQAGTFPFRRNGERNDHHIRVEGPYRFHSQQFELDGPLDRLRQGHNASLSGTTQLARLGCKPFGLRGVFLRVTQFEGDPGTTAPVGQAVEQEVGKPQTVGGGSGHGVPSQLAQRRGVRITYANSQNI